MKKINFLMGLHCHQPVDNFENIFEDAFNKSYEPFLNVLKRHPKIKLSLHYSGSLLDWIIAKKPFFLESLNKLVAKGQVELLTGGYFEPVLSMVPARDATGQIEMLTNTIEKYFKVRPKGMWLSERVWDPSLSRVLKNLNIKYTIVDDYHLKMAGLRDKTISGRYTVNGLDDFSVFPAIKKLRYTMPFKEPQVTIDYLKHLLENEDARLVTFADDCEKFGFWPYTYNWVYKKGWLDKFFKKLEEADWIETSTFQEALDRSHPRQAVDIPHSSYSEMAEWSGGNFNNFFKKYPESELMKNRMLYISDKLNDRVNSIGTENVDISSRNTMITSARNELYKSQSNCAYWHGMFGGVYLTHLRQGIYKHLIRAENTLEENNTQVVIEKVGLSKNIISMQNKSLNIFVDQDSAGSVLEIDYKPLSCNLVNTMSRQYEPYHEKISKKKYAAAKKLKTFSDFDDSVDLYEVLGVKERNLRRFLNYDHYKKAAFVCHAMGLKASLDDFVKSKHAEFSEKSLLGGYRSEIKTADKVKYIFLEKNGEVKIENKPYLMRISKSLFLKEEDVISTVVEIENLSDEAVNFIFGIEFNWSLESSLFPRAVKKNNIKRIKFCDKFSKLKIEHTFNAPMGLWLFPVYTLNESERGLGKNFQETSIMFHKKLKLKPNDKFCLDGKIRISK
ncbi:MAG: alpha-amylase/4-alpha-glucanotransferase domain-containing protein [Candidatus Omnitrophota bacterium]